MLERNSVFKLHQLKKSFCLPWFINNDLKAQGYKCGQLQTYLWSIPDLISGLLISRSENSITPLYRLFQTMSLFLHFLSPNCLIFFLPEWLAKPLSVRRHRGSERWNDWSLGFGDYHWGRRTKHQQQTAADLEVKDSTFLDCLQLYYWQIRFVDAELYSSYFTLGFDTSFFK